MRAASWLLAFGAVQRGSGAHLVLWSRDFFDAFGCPDASALRAKAPPAGASILVAILSVWTRMTTARKWRAWLTRHLIDRWLANDRFRRLHFQASEDQNPEYRIAGFASRSLPAA